MDLNFDNNTFDKLSDTLDTVFPEVLVVFFQETEASIIDLKAKIETDEIDKVHNIVHKIKSSTKTFGATGLVALLEQIEATEVKNEIQILYQIFTSEYKLVKQHILDKMN